MKKKSVYILKIILGGYLAFIGISLFVLMQQQKPSNMISLSALGAISAMIGIIYAVYFLMKVLNIKNMDRGSDSGKFWKTAVGKAVAGIWNSVTGKLTRIHMKRRKQEASDATEEMPVAEIRQMAAQTALNTGEEEKQEKIPAPMPVVGEETGGQDATQDKVQNVTPDEAQNVTPDEVQDITPNIAPNMAQNVTESEPVKEENIVWDNSKGSEEENGETEKDNKDDNQNNVLRI